MEPCMATPSQLSYGSVYGHTQSTVLWNLVWPHPVNCLMEACMATPSLLSYGTLQGHTQSTVLWNPARPHPVYCLMEPCKATPSLLSYGTLKATQSTILWNPAKPHPVYHLMEPCKATPSQPSYGTLQGHTQSTILWYPARPHPVYHLMKPCKATPSHVSFWSLQGNQLLLWTHHHSFNSYSCKRASNPTLNEYLSARVPHMMRPEALQMAANAPTQARNTSSLMNVWPYAWNAGAWKEYIFTDVHLAVHM